MVDHAVGYGVFATGGTRHDAVSIREIRDLQGNVLDKPTSPQGKRVISEQEAYLITYILKDYSSAWNLGWNKPFAGKSGTTNNYHDAWMMAYAPNLVIGAWVGNTSGSGDKNMNAVYGSMVGSSVLRDFINNGLSQANFKVENFQRPSGLIDGGPCSNNSNVSPSGSASPSASSSPSSRNVGNEKEIYLPGTQCVASTPSPSASTAPSIIATPSLPVCPTPTPTPTPGFP